MKWLYGAMALLLAAGCQSRPAGVWEGGETSYARSVSERSFWGNQLESSLALGEDEFLGPSSEEFIPLAEDDLRPQLAGQTLPPLPIAPGEVGSGLPHMNQFAKPSEWLASLFRTIYFNTDEYVVREKEYLNYVNRIAAYLKEHPKTYIVVEGHCDQRGPSAYNLALGTRRAQQVRSLLLQRGVRNEQIHTVSYGKEKLADPANNRLAWSKNRRVEFRIHEKP